MKRYSKARNKSHHPPDSAIDDMVNLDDSLFFTIFKHVLQNYFDRVTSQMPLIISDWVLEDYPRPRGQILAALALPLISNCSDLGFGLEQL